MTPAAVLARPVLAEAIGRIVDREGRTFSYRKNDRGGATKFGITRIFLADLFGRTVPVSEIETLDEQRARTCYAMFLSKYGFDRLAAPRLLDHVLDFAVHSGPLVAIRALQVAAGVTVDGVLGPATAAAANGGDAELLCDRVMAARLELLGALLKRPGQAENALGWLRRIGALLTWRPGTHTEGDLTL